MNSNSTHTSISVITERAGNLNLRSQSLWASAVEQLSAKDKASIGGFQEIHITVVSEVLRIAQAKRDAAAAKRWTFRGRDGRVVIVRDVFEKIVGVISKFATAVNVAVNADPVHAGLPWAAIQFLLQVSANDLSAYGSMSEGIETVTTIIVRYAFLEQLHCSDSPTGDAQALQHLRGCMVSVYATILAYLAQCSKYWSHSPARRTVQSVSGNVEAIASLLKNNLLQADNEVWRVLQLIQYQGLSTEMALLRQTFEDSLASMEKPLWRTAQDVSKVHDRHIRKTRREIFRWLSQIDCEGHHEEVSKGILDGTGQWLLKSSTYLNWLKSSSSSIFWLHGIPGAGKTKLTSIVIKSLLDEDLIVSTTHPPVAFFYASRNPAEPERARPEEIWRAILRQLCASNAGLPLRGSIADEYQRRKDRADDRGAAVAKLDIDETTKWVLKIAADGPIIVVIDAFDEIDDPDRGVLLDILQRVVEEAQNVTKIFVSSRRDADVVEMFGNCMNVGITEKLNHKDLEYFIKTQVNRAITGRKILRGKVSPELKTDIVDTFLSKASGIWVDLSVQTLSDPKRLSLENDVRSVLGKLPLTLKEQYAAIYEDIMHGGPVSITLAMNAFSWILAAQKPLSTIEFLDAVAVNQEGRVIDFINEAKILEICRNLLEIDEASTPKVFRVAHLSVREFLEQHPDYTPVQIHTLLTSRCLDFVSPTQPSALANEGIPRYGVYIFEHARLSDLIEAESLLAHKMKDFLFDGDFGASSALQLWYQLVDKLLEDSFSLGALRDQGLIIRMRQFLEPDPPPSILVSAFGLLSVLNMMLLSRKQVQWQPSVAGGYGYHCYGLRLAVENARYAVVETLLNHQIFVADELNDSICLYEAVQSQRKDMVKLLLDHGADPVRDLCSGETPTIAPIFGPLKPDSMNNDIQMLQELVEAAERTTRSRTHDPSNPAFVWKDEALFMALARDWPEAVSLLIDHDANIYARTTNHTWAGHVSDKSRDQNPRSTTLQIAVQYSQLATIKRLLHRFGLRPENSVGLITPASSICKTLERSAINIRDDVGKAPLHYLVDRVAKSSEDTKAVMQVLIAYGADLMAKSKEGMTALHVAASVGDLLALDALMRLGLDLNALTERGATLLHVAAMGQYDTSLMIRTLIHKGLDAQARDDDSNTPIHYAAASCNHAALHALLEPNATGALSSRYISSPVSQTVPTKEYAATLRNQVGQTALHVVGLSSNDTKGFEDIEEPAKAVVKTLIMAGCGIEEEAHNGRTPLCAITSTSVRRIGGYAAVEQLLDEGANPISPDLAGRTPLHFASQWPSENLLGMVKDGVALESKDNWGYTPLHAACRQGNQNTIWFLLAAKANINAQDRQGASTLHHTIFNETWGVHIIPLLLRNGVSVQVRDAQDATPLHWAADRDCRNEVLLLLRKGADPEALDVNGRSPLHLAAERGYVWTWRTLYKAIEMRPRKFSDRNGFGMQRRQSQIGITGSKRPFLGQHLTRRASV